MFHDLLPGRVDQVTMNIFSDLLPCLRCQMFNDLPVYLVRGYKMAGLELAIGQEFRYPSRDFFNAAPVVLEPDIVSLAVRPI